MSRTQFALRTLAALALGLAVTLGGPHAAAYAASPDGLAIDVTGASEPVLCAEKDNVTLNFASPAVRQFRIEAAHPAYIASVQRDSFEADWTACDLSGDPVHASGVKTPTRRTLYEEPDFWLVGWTMPTYWRPATATVRIGDQVTAGLHLIQLWMIRPMGGEEVLVLYPQDGYWRLRPLAPAGQAPTAFGSSFLVGPVEIDGRPIVKIKEVAFEPATRTFTLMFERGGSATLKLAKVDANRHALDVAFEPKSRTFTLSFERGGTAIVKLAKVDQNRHVLDVAFDHNIVGRPFAALRSMYVTEFNNDVARIAVRERGAKGWHEEPVLGFKKATATDIWAGRTMVSRHNTSSPDMVFSGFQGEAGKPVAKKAVP